MKSRSDICRDMKELPSVEELERELHRVQYNERYRKVFKNTIDLLLLAAALAILVVTLWMPVLRVCGTSMTPTLKDGEIVVLTKSSNFKTGEILAFYYNNKILIKRVIAQSGDWVDMSEDGVVFVNGKKLEEPYVSELAYGECDLKFPYQVPVNRVFVMGDHRTVSIDSRNSQIGCVAEEQVVGKLKVRLWPLQRIGGF